MVIPAGRSRRTPHLQTHEGYEWVYVLDGNLRLVLAPQGSGQQGSGQQGSGQQHDLVLAAGEAAEFDTRTPHWFGAADDDAVEFLSLFGKHGERAHLRARPKAAT
jgi:quercetin dioxygenase-like cupin family protein